MRVVFMGTPGFAVPCLHALIRENYDIAGVFSQPDKPRGRGHKTSPAPVKELALQHEIPVYQPENMRDGHALSILRELAPDLIVVVAYGRILLPEILSLPQYGCINVHASLLPKLRGAAPIQWSIINGDGETGVTTMFMEEGIDTGDMILSLKTKILPDETAGELFERLAPLGATALAETTALIASGNAVRQKQDDSLATYAPMIKKELANLDFTKEPKALCDLIRGLNPAPMAFTRLDGKVLKVAGAKPVSGFFGGPGEILDEKRLIAGCGSGAVELLSVRPEGKKPMTGAEFLRGKRLTAGQMFTRD